MNTHRCRKPFKSDVELLMARNDARFEYIRYRIRNIPAHIDGGKMSLFSISISFTSVLLWGKGSEVSVSA